MKHRNVLLAIALVVIGLFMGACAGDPNVELLAAAETGNVSQIQELLAGTADLNTRDEFDRTPLMIASLNGHEEVVDTLLKAGADINAEAKFGQTALQFAEEQGHTRIIELIKNGNGK